MLSLHLHLCLCLLAQRLTLIKNSDDTLLLVAVSTQVSSEPNPSFLLSPSFSPLPFTYLSPSYHHFTSNLSCAYFTVLTVCFPGVRDISEKVTLPPNSFEAIDLVVSTYVRALCHVLVCITRHPLKLSACSLTTSFFDCFPSLCCAVPLWCDRRLNMTTCEVATYASTSVCSLQ